MMKKLNALNLGKGLTRIEMKNISGGLLPGGGGGELGGCENECNADSDCASKTCGAQWGGGTMKCGRIACAGTSNTKWVCGCEFK